MFYPSPTYISADVRCYISGDGPTRSPHPAGHEPGEYGFDNLALWGRDEGRGGPPCDLRPTVYTEVVEAEGQIIGFFSVEAQDGNLFINALQVKKGYQGQGYGTAMMARIETSPAPKGHPSSSYGCS